VNSAGRREFRSSLSSGAVFARVGPAAASTAERTTSFQSTAFRRRRRHISCWHFENGLKSPEAMPASDFHKRPFDEGTLTKLQIFELYAREWLPVFLSPERPPRSEIHLFDFFAGPGTDSDGELGSPLRLLR
jgi:hypothetical protein